MEEARRRRYLAAMGIPLWLPRSAAQTLPIDNPPDRPPAEVSAAATANAASPPPDIPGDEPPAPLREAADELFPPTTPLPLETPRPISPDTTSSSTGDPSDLGWDELAVRVAECQACDELVRNRHRTVFGTGNRGAELMLIGEAPGVDEDRQGEPFVGRAGQLLNLMLRAMGFSREQVYIANILKCRPPGNRDPHVHEAQNCESFLLRQLELVAPKVILSVGRISAHNLLKSDDTVGRLRGRVHYYGPNQIPLVVTYHPAYLLRSPEQKAKAWADLQLAMATLKQH